MTQRIGRRKRAPTSQSFFLITARAFKKPRAYTSILLPTVPLTIETCTMTSRSRSVLHVSPHAQGASTPAPLRVLRANKLHAEPALAPAFKHTKHTTHTTHTTNHKPQTTNYASCTMHHAPCIMYHAPCTMQQTLRRFTALPLQPARQKPRHIRHRERNAAQVALARHTRNWSRIN